MRVGSGRFLCCVGSSCEGVDSNQLLPLRWELWVHINVYFGKSELHFDVHVKMASVLTPGGGRFFITGAN